MSQGLPMHAWTHRPGGRDPIQFPGGVDPAQEYFEAFWNENLNALDLEDGTGAMVGHIQGAPAPDPNFDPSPSEGGVALLQGGDQVPHVRGMLIVGNASGIVIDAGQMATINMLAIKPTWTNDPVGNGPYLYLQTKVGQGVIRQWSADPVNPPAYQFDLFVDFNDAGHGLLTCRNPDGSLVTATNPVTWAVDDEVNAFWSTFTRNWD